MFVWNHKNPKWNHNENLLERMTLCQQSQEALMRQRVYGSLECATYEAGCVFSLRATTLYAWSSLMRASNMWLLHIITARFPRQSSRCHVTFLLHPVHSATTRTDRRQKKRKQSCTQNCTKFTTRRCLNYATLYCTNIFFASCTGCQWCYRSCTIWHTFAKFQIKNCFFPPLRYFLQFTLTNKGIIIE